MPPAGYLAALLIGLLGGTHCVGMCGGFVAALSANLPGSARRQWVMHMAYNLGRITTYTAVGALLGGLGAMGFVLNRVLPVQMGFYVAANLMLVLLGLYLAGYTTPLMPLERLGGRLWQRLRPLSARFLAARDPLRGYPLGLIWGFLPCGLVYSVLSTALVSGSASRGAGIMLAFGLGTLPNLLLAGFFAARIRCWLQRRPVRVAAGLLVMVFGVVGLFNATTLGGKLWQGVICHVV